MKGEVNENLVSYVKVVSAGRKARQIEILNKDLESLYDRYCNFLGSDKADYSGLLFARTFMRNLAKQYQVDYDSMLREHIMFLESR